jgi:hypothetical protein
MRTIVIYIFVSVLVSCISCSRRTQLSEEWKPDTKKIDALIGRDGIPGSNIVFAVHKFYDSMRAKQWDRTYEFRTAAFRRSVPRDLYLRSMQRDGQKWKLLDYKILAVDVYGEKVRLVVEFTEMPGNHKGVSVVWWKNEINGWRCEEAGPFLLNLAKRVTSPE